MNAVVPKVALPAAPWLARPRLIARRAGYAFHLLLEQRLWLYLVGDAFFLFIGVLEAIDAMGGGDWMDRIYPRVIILPMLILGLPAMSGVLALERRAGSLDLALAVPSTERYFVRRIAPVCAFMMMQSWIVLVFVTEGWELARALVQSTVLCLLVGALALFWAVRLATSGAVVVASLTTVALMSPWIFFSPATRVAIGVAEDVWGIPLAVLAWCWKVAVGALAAAIFFLYARERLRRPETLLV